MTDKPKSALDVAVAALEILRDRVAGGSATREIARAALEAAERVQAEEALAAIRSEPVSNFVCSAVCCDESHPDHVGELRRLLAEANADAPVETLADDAELVAYVEDHAVLSTMEKRDLGALLDCIDKFRRERAR